MSVGIARLEPGRVAGAQCFLPRVGDEDHLAGQDVHELVFDGMPVALTGGNPWLQPEQVHAKLRQSCRIADSLALARPARLIVWGWIHGSNHAREAGNVDTLGHGCALSG